MPACSLVFCNAPKWSPIMKLIFMKSCLGISLLALLVHHSIKTFINIHGRLISFSYCFPSLWIPFSITATLLTSHWLQIKCNINSLSLEIVCYPDTLEKWEVFHPERQSEANSPHAPVLQQLVDSVWRHFLKRESSFRFYMHDADFTDMNVEDRRVETIRSLMFNQCDRVGGCEG